MTRGNADRNVKSAALARHSSQPGECVRTRRQHGAREPRILVHPADESLDAVELELRPDPVDEGDVQDLAIEIAGKIEQEDFEQHRALVEHRPPSKVGDAIIAPRADPYAHPIDAVLQAATGVEPQ